MPRAVRALAVWANGSLIGEWRASARGHAELHYDESWLASEEARPLSLSLQLAKVTHKSPAVDSYFDNLLPDSEAIRRRLQERFQTPSRGAFDLLAAIGRDCVGAVQLLPPGETPDPQRVDARPLTATEIERELAGITLPGAPGGRDEEFRISIAGAQEKTALLKRGTRWCRPLGSTPTTHIFKLPLGLVGNRRADMRTSVENEWLCARIVAAFGLPVASCDIAQFGAMKVLIVERFDRLLHSSGAHWLRLMQEDFCQATATPFHRKYQSDGGPGLTEIARILRGSAESRRDLETLFRAQVLFYLLAATDGHAKNFSIRLLAGTRFQLTPLYDVLSAWPVIGKRANELPYEKTRLAMALPGTRPSYHLKMVQRRHFLELARRLGLGADAHRILDEMLERVADVESAVQRDLPRDYPQPLLETVFGGIRRHARVLGGEVRDASD